MNRAELRSSSVRNCPKSISLQPAMHVYEIRPRKDKRGVDLISDVLPFGRLWYGEPGAVSNAIWLREVLQPFT